MKNCVIGLFFILAAFHLDAQITIDSSHVNLPGNTLERRIDTSANVSLGSAASGQSWNFTLNNHESDFVEFLQPGGLPLSSVYPTSNLVLTFSQDNDSSWVFLEKSDTALRILGIVNVYEIDGIGDTVAEPFTAKVISFPSSLGVTYTENSSIDDIENFQGDPDGAGPHPYVDSIKYTYSTFSNSLIDADGLLNINNTCQYDAVRQKYVEIYQDSVSMFVNGSWTTISPLMLTIVSQPAVSRDTSIYFRWWTTDSRVGFPIVECEVDENDNIIGQLDWIYDVCTGLNETAGSSVSVFPNPAQNELRIKSINPNSGPLTISMYDLNGKLVLKEVFTNNRISLPSLNEGSYLYTLTDSLGQTLIIEKLIIKK